MRVGGIFNRELYRFEFADCAVAFVAAREEWWLWLSAPALGSRAWWFVARGRRRARMCSLEMWESRFVIVAGDPLISRRSGKMGCPL
ncbi:MAG TPA: hypothetical protein VGR84_17535, partial [Candidatus Acidoferrales bacterium]|nr:hypothetical protein [Candidatus Acidoferrales bacterium]